MRDQRYPWAQRVRYHGRQLLLAAVARNPQRRQAIRRHYAFNLVLRRLTPLVAVDANGMRYLVNSGDSLGSGVFVQGNHQQNLMEKCLHILATRSGRDPFLAGRDFVDIGANIGTSTIPALKLFHAASAIAIEPEPGNYRLLRCNLALNDVESRVRTFQVALSADDGGVELELSRDNFGDHRIRMAPLEDGRFRESGRDSITVPAVRLDSLAETEGVDFDRVGLVWMDVQGHEGHVLAGATSTVVHRDIPVVVEYWPYALRRAGGLSLFNDLIESNYRAVIDLRATQSGPAEKGLPASRIDEITARLTDTKDTDLLLLK